FVIFVAFVPRPWPVKPVHWIYKYASTNISRHHGAVADLRSLQDRGGGRPDSPGDRTGSEDELDPAAGGSADSSRTGAGGAAGRRRTGGRQSEEEKGGAAARAGGHAGSDGARCRPRSANPAPRRARH